jgi:hypothetical protein
MKDLANFRGSIFETQTLLNWRHSPETLRLLRESQQLQQTAPAEARGLYYSLNQDSFASVETSCAAFSFNQTNISAAEPTGPVFIFNPVDVALDDASWARCFDLSFQTTGQSCFFASTSTDTLTSSSNFAQIASVDSYRELFRAAVEGNALNTSFQFQTFLNFLDVDLTLERTWSLFDIDVGINRQAIADFVICNGERRLSWENIHAIWTDVDAQLSQTGRFASGFEVVQYLRERISANSSLRTTCVVVSYKNVAPSWAPSTHEWVHSFVLWTGISPPVEDSDMDANCVCNTQRSKSQENYRDFLFRQEDRPRRPRVRRARSSKPSSKTGCSTNRYLVGRLKVRRSPVRRTRSYRQKDRHEAA